MEIGYNWNPYVPKDKDGIVRVNETYNPIYLSSTLDQYNFRLERSNEIKNTKDERAIDCLYWDPVFIEVIGLGWEWGSENPLSNMRFFDFSEISLKVLDAFKYNNKI